MNNWHDVWNKKSNKINKNEDVFSVFKALKIADGFDVLAEDGYYEALYQDFKDMLEQIHGKIANYDSVYEVGCGSGVNLFLFRELEGIQKLGGCDYSESLIKIARDVIESDDLVLCDAEEVNTDRKYDIVLADSVFQYFTSPEKGYNVLQKMFDKSNKMVIITELHDKAMEEEHLAYRRSMVENYDELYKGLEKTFYERDRFLDFPKHTDMQCTCEIVRPNNDKYWNNRFVFDFYLLKKEK